ncbi:hypothetical protein OH77DRAFT_1525472 [Trametes cingulata]|nr:hypothetical protein OH77DRAFT_1525472 [Trametes cingulata]
MPPAAGVSRLVADSQRANYAEGVALPVVIPDQSNGHIGPPNHTHEASPYPPDPQWQGVPYVPHAYYNTHSPRFHAPPPPPVHLPEFAPYVHPSTTYPALVPPHAPALPHSYSYTAAGNLERQYDDAGDRSMPEIGCASATNAQLHMSPSGELEWHHSLPDDFLPTPVDSAEREERDG